MVTTLKPGAVAIITNRSKNKLLLQQKDETHPVLSFRNRFSLFGGSLEPGESSEEGLLRELSEEISDIEQFNLQPEYWLDFELFGLEDYYTISVYIITMEDQQFEALATCVVDDDLVQEGGAVVVETLIALLMVEYPDCFIASLNEVLYTYLKTADLPRSAWTLSRVFDDTKLEDLDYGRFVIEVIEEQLQFELVGWGRDHRGYDYELKGDLILRFYEEEEIEEREEGAIGTIPPYDTFQYSDEEIPFQYFELTMIPGPEGIGHEVPSSEESPYRVMIGLYFNPDEDGLLEVGLYYEGGGQNQFYYRVNG